MALRRGWLGLALSVGLAAMAPAARADAVYLVTGVMHGHDQTDFFDEGVDFEDVPFAITFTRTSNAAGVLTDFGGTSSAFYSPGSGFFADLTIGSVPLRLGYTVGGQSQSRGADACGGYGGCFQLYAANQGGGPIPGRDERQDYDYSVVVNGYVDGRGWRRDYRRLGDLGPDDLRLGAGVFTFRNSYTDLETGDVFTAQDVVAYLTPRSLTVLSAHDGVPEPQAWALMILGFVAVGAVLRRREVRRLSTAGVWRRGGTGEPPAPLAEERERAPCASR